jgi:hypothetical protein
MDHESHGGGPLPPPLELTFSADVGIVSETPNGAARFFAGWQGVWDGTAHAIEVNFFMDKWGHSPNWPEDVTVRFPEIDYTILDGKYHDIFLAPSGGTLHVSWKTLISNAVSRGLLVAPKGGWQSASTQAVFIGSETLNYKRDHAVRANVSIERFLVERNP